MSAGGRIWKGDPNELPEDDFWKKPQDRGPFPGSNHLEPFIRIFEAALQLEPRLWGAIDEAAEEYVATQFRYDTVPHCYSEPPEIMGRVCVCDLKDQPPKASAATQTAPPEETRAKRQKVSITTVSTQTYPVDFHLAYAKQRQIEEPYKIHTESATASETKKATLDP